MGITITMAFSSRRSGAKGDITIMDYANVATSFPALSN